MIQRVSKIMQKLRPTAGFWILIHHFWLLYRGDTPHIIVLQDTNDSAESTRHGQNQEKELKTPTTELNIFQIFFNGKK